MNIFDLDRSPGLVYSTPALGSSARLWFRSNTVEPMRVDLDADGKIICERPYPDVATDCPDGWEPADPFPAEAIVRPEDWQDQPEQPVVAP